MSTKSKVRANGKGIVTSFTVIALGIGLGSSAIVSSLSLFLVEKISYSSSGVGLVFTLLALAGIAANQITGLISDRSGNRRMVIAICAISSAMGAILLAFSELQPALVPAFLCMFSFAAGATSQTFAYSRELAESEMSQKHVSQLNSVIRACFALSWVCGPPLVFGLVKEVGFRPTYLLASGFFLLSSLVAALLKSSFSSRKTSQELTTNVSPSLDIRSSAMVIVSLVSLTLVYSANHIYIISLPIYLSTVVQLEPHLAGYLMGAAALVEIPVIVAFGYLANSYSRSALVAFGIATGCVFFAGVVISDQYWHLLALQMFNALLIGSVAVCGLLMIQDMLPDKLGAASALYTNTTLAGSVIGSLTLVFLPHSETYHLVMPVALLALLLALVLSVIVCVGLKGKKASRPVREEYAQ